MDPPTQSNQRTPLTDLSNTINTAVVDTSNGGEPTDVKERNRQRARERYAQMPPEKKDELLKKRREAYQQKKARLAVSTRGSGDSSSTLCQLQSTPVVSDNAWNKENVVPVDDYAYRRHSLLTSSQWQESLLSDNVDTPFIVPTQPIDPEERKRQRERERYAQMDSTKKEEILKRKREARKERKTSTCNKENESIAEDDEWLRRNDNYQRQPIHVPFQEQEIITSDIVDMNICGNDGPSPPLIQPQPVDRIERRRQQARERYARMSNDKKNEQLANRREAYHQMKSLAEKIEAR